MAFYRKLTEGWRLTDGILPPVLLGTPGPVYEALRENGSLPDAQEGMNALCCEWIAAREWTYSLLLDAPGEDDERILLELPRVSHAGSAYVNGEFIDDFLPGAVRLDLTGAIRQEETNRLEIRFAPSPHVRPRNGLPVPEIGLLAAPVVRAVNFAEATALSLTARSEGEDGVLSFEMDVNAHTAGRYGFHYALMLDGEAAGTFDFTEKLPAAKRHIRHEIRVRNAVFFQAKQPEETVYSIKFTIERGGIGCDVRHMETAFRKSMPARCLAISAWPVPEETIEGLVSLGAQGILLAGAPDNRPVKNDFLGGLTVVESVPVSGAVGMLRADDMKKYAAGENFWPMDGTMWRLRGGETPDMSPEEGEEADRFALRVRYTQAVSVRRAAECARRDKKAAAFPADEKYAFFAGRSVIERSGKLRPAARMLEKVWGTAHVFPEIQERGQLAVWALAENLPGRVLKASVLAANLRGEKLAEASFPVMGGDVRLAGVMALPAQDEPLIIRTTLTGDRGELLSGTDELVGGAALEKASLSCADGTIRNEGDCAAVSAEMILLPGEEAEACAAEWLNA